MAENQVRVGAQIASDGSLVTARGTRTGASGTADVQARFQEAVMGGYCFSVCSQSALTIPAGLSAAPTTPVLYNPAGSGKNLVVWHVGLGNLVVWAAVSAVGIGISRNVVAAAITGTAAAPKNLLAGSGNASVATPLTTATLPAAPIYDFLLGVGSTGAVVLLPQIPLLERWFDGSLILGPGTAASIQASTASGAGAWCEWQWQEVPI